MGDPDAALAACAHCGQQHPESVLVCPNTNRLLPLTGRVLDNRFRFVRKLGEGGMSTVWLAENYRVRKRVAIKIMHPEYARNPRTLHRFQNEATSAGRIGNPHICDILDLGESPLGPYIVMEALVGQSFAELLEDQGQVEPTLAVLIVREALKGLSAAHHAGIIHRDLKPENVFLHEPEPGRMLVKLMDFGISKFTEEPGGGRTGANVVMGTPEYMSPEQAAGAANVDARTDIWAMGVMLYRALTGLEPFRGKTMAALLLALTTEPHEPVPKYAPNVAPGLVAIVDRCLHKEPGARFDTADALYQALEPYQQAVADGERPMAPVRTGRTMAVGLDAAAAAALRAGPSGGPVPTRPGVLPPGVGQPSLPGVAHPGTRPGAQHTRVSQAGTGAGTGLGLGTTPGGTQVSMPGTMPSQPGTTRSSMPSSPGVAQNAATGTTPSVGIDSAGTWSSELDPKLADAEESWSMGQQPVNDDRRRRSEGGGWWIVLIVLLGLGLIGGGVGWAWSAGYLDHVAAGEDEDEGEGELDGDDEDAATEDGTGDETGVVAGATSAGETAETGETGGAAETGETGAAAETGETGAASDAGDETTDDADESTDDGDESTTTGGGTTGGGGNDTPKPNLSKVYRSGNLYTPKARGPNGDHASAKSYCRKLDRQKKYGFTKWRLASVSELNGFRNSGVDKLLYWSRETEGDDARAVSMMQGRVLTKPKSDKAPRAFCVSPK